jgi:outer membrane protein
MTSRRAHTLCFGLILTFAMTCSAQAQNAKVGFVNIPFILQQHPRTQQVNETLRSEFAPREAELKETQTKLQEDADKYARNRDAMSESERAAKERELNDRNRELMRRVDALNEDLQVRQNELGQELQREIAVQIQDYCEDAGYDLVVADAIYVSEDFDITTEVFEAITKK